MPSAKETAMSLPDSQKAALVRQAEELCRSRGARLLFLTLFGSTLYGTELSGRSDLDVRGVFLPAPESLEHGNGSADGLRGIHSSTATGERRNTSSDVDMDLWPLQRWLLDLLPTGDIGALDLLFAPSRPECVLYRSSLLDPVFAKPLRLVDTARGRAYAEYSLNQAKSYGIRGTRAGALKCVYGWLAARYPHPGQPAREDRLRDYLEDLAQSCADGRHCLVVDKEDGPALLLAGKYHPGVVRMSEFRQRVESGMRRFGERALLAEQGQGLDFKALSHALRALDQMEELLTTGRIVFPLRTREELMAVKRGEYSWSELEPRILDGIARIDALRAVAPVSGVFDRNFAQACIDSCYASEGSAPV